jgi:ribosomal protein S18 acetylase RimI-like enzyme
MAADKAGAPTLCLRRAVRKDAAQLSDIAMAAKNSWGYPAQWMEQWRAQLTIAEAYIDAVPVFVAEQAGQIVGFCAVEGQSPEHASLEHMWVMPAAMGRGVGRALLRRAADHAAAMNVRWLEIESDPHAVAFYRRMGATLIGETSYVLAGQTRTLPVLRLEVRPDDDAQ